MSTNPILEEINDVYTGLLALSKLFVQSNPKDTQQTHHEEWRRGICTQNGYNTGTKGRKKLYPRMSCSPKQIFQETWSSPWDRFAQEAIPLLKLTKSRQGGTADRWGPLQHLPNPQPKYHNLSWEIPTELAKGISVVVYWLQGRSSARFNPHAPYTHTHTVFSGSFSHSLTTIKAAIKTTSYLNIFYSSKSELLRTNNNIWRSLRANSTLLNNHTPKNIRNFQQCTYRHWWSRLSSAILSWRFMYSLPFTVSNTLVDG